MKSIGKFLLLTFSLMMFAVGIIGVGWIGYEQYQEGSFIGFLICLAIVVYVFVWFFRKVGSLKNIKGWLPWNNY